jgi:hypothetical protein
MDFREFMHNVSKIKTQSETKMCRNGKCVCTKNGKSTPCKKNKKLNKTFKKPFSFFNNSFFNKSNKKRKKKY